MTVDEVVTRCRMLINDEQLRTDEIRGLCAQYLRAADRCDAVPQQGERDGK